MSAAGTPPAAVPYKRTSVFDESTLPVGLRNQHPPMPGARGRPGVLDADGVVERSTGLRDGP